MKYNYHLLCLLLICLNSCVSTKNNTYFQDIVNTEVISVYDQNEYKINNNDALKITISTEDPSAIISLNFNSNEKIGQNQQIENTENRQNCYNQIFVVNDSGYVIIPSLGEIKIVGLNKTEAADVIEKKLATYIKNPIVSVEYYNYKITILGEVNKPGTYKTEQHINILDALGLAGDITTYGKLNNILLIRKQENGKLNFIKLDLTKKEIFSSPYFYLQPNDVLYVEPTKTKTTNFNSKNLPLYIGSISTLALVATTIVAILKIK